MPNKVYALLVGVNDYGPDIESLDGCLNDVDLLHEYLNRRVGSPALAVQVLKNNDATRANVISQFRSHLGQARSGDVALFQFCGHGARWASNAAFRESFPDGKDEGLVCSDSRQPGGYDLADKELAVLIAEVAGNGAHVAVLFDCCHSGSGTRDVSAVRGLKPRLTHEVTTERPLDTYLDGHYSRLRETRQPLFVPTGRHILLAACERGQLAQETPGHGLFTSTLIDVLEKSGGDLSYADLFVRCRAAVRSRAFDQDPQFEAYDRFDAGAGFLGRPWPPRHVVDIWSLATRARGPSGAGPLTAYRANRGPWSHSRCTPQLTRRHLLAAHVRCRSGRSRVKSSSISTVPNQRSTSPRSPACPRHRCP